MNTRKWLQVGLTLLCSLGAVSVEAAPTLTVGSASGQAGASVTLPVTFNPGTSSVASLQFSLTLPPGLSTGAITPGAILTSAGKSVSSNLTGSTVTFIIFGFNQTPITSGSLLTTKLTISLGTAVGNLSLPVSGVFYSDPNGAVIAAGASTGGTVSVLPPVPTITSAGTATGQAGTAFSYQITASNSPTSFNATGLPAGLSVSTTTGLISGTPTAAATSNVTLSASNAGGTGTRTLTLTINPPAPAITSAGTATGQVGTAFSYQIAASNSPTRFNATGLPAGLSVSTTTGLISGTPTAAATSNVALSASNAGGTGTKTLILTITAPAPAITSAGTATGQVGTAFSYQITASNSPTSFNATGLPAGLSVSTTTGLISGTPTAAATSNVALSASNAGGTGTRTLALTVYSACDLNQDGASNVVDVQLQVNQALGVTACTSDLNSDGACNVIDIQRDVNASLGLLCVVGP